MGLESGTYISDLVATNPLASDSRSQGDDHLRLIKATIKSTFPSVSGAVTATHAELSDVVNKAPKASPEFTGDVYMNGRTRSRVEAVGAGTTIDCSLANYFTKTMSANWTPTLSNVPAGAFGFVIEMTWSAGALTLPAGWEWAGNEAPILEAGVWVLAWLTGDGGTTGIVAANKLGA